LPVSKWEYKDALGESHIGPMAQDFYAAFGLGAEPRPIQSSLQVYIVAYMGLLKL